MSQPSISVVICAYTLDRLTDIHEAVTSLLAQTLKPHEIIVAVDHNEELHHTLQAELPPDVKLVLNDGTTGLSETRNVGINTSTGSVVAFIDDDAVAENTWLEELTKHFRNPHVAAVGGKVRPHWPGGKRPGWFPAQLDWIVGCTYKGLPLNGNEIRNMIGCNMAFRKEVFEQAGLFRSEVGRVGKTQGVGEEADICLRIKRAMPESSIVYEPNAVVRHKVPLGRLGLRYLVQRSYNEGYYKNLVKRLAPGSASEPLSVENIYLRYLLLQAIPQRMRRFYDKWSLAQAVAIIISIAAASLGYLWADLKHWQANHGQRQGIKDMKLFVDRSARGITRQITRMNLSEISPGNRTLLWVLLLLLTSALLLSPIQLADEYRPIQAPYLFNNLALFSILFFGWLLLILILAFSRKDKAGKFSWEKLAISCIFGLVFIGFWVVITPYGSYADGIYNMGHVRYILDEGVIPVGHQNLQYFDYPGMHLLGASLSQVTGLDVLDTRMFFLLFNAVLFSALLYVLFTKFLRSSHLSFLGMMLVLMGSVALVEKMHIFTPGAFGFTLLAGILLLFTMMRENMFEKNVIARTAILILFAAIVVSYFPISFLVPLILLGIYTVCLIAKDKENKPNLATIVLMFVMVIAWGMYWTWHTFDTLTSFLPDAWDNIASREFLTTILTLGQANIGEILPVWASVTRAFWWILLAFGTIIGLRNVFKLRDMSQADKTVTGALLGVILLTIIGTFGTRAGAQFTRYLLYAPLFAAPILLLYLTRQAGWRRAALAFLYVFLIILSLPSFLSSVNLIQTEAIYDREISAWNFMEASINSPNTDYTLYGLTWASVSPANYYVPDSKVKRVNENLYYEGSKIEVWQAAGTLIDEFKHMWVLPITTKALILTEKDAAVFEHLVGISPEDQGWKNFHELLDNTNEVYSNGYVDSYLSWQ